LSAFVEALDELDSLAFWQEPLDVLEVGHEFVQHAEAFITNQLDKLSVATLAPETEIKLCEELALALRAYVGFSTKSGLSDFFIQSLSLVARVESHLQASDRQKAALAKVMDSVRPHLKKYLHYINDQFKKRNNVRYLDSSNASGVFSIAKFFSTS
jgi:hypothetical protein